MTERYYIYQVSYNVNNKEYISDTYMDKKYNHKNWNQVTVKYNENHPDKLFDVRKSGNFGFFGIITGIALLLLSKIDYKRSETY